MRKNVLFIFLLFLFVNLSFSQKTNVVNKNMMNVTWDNETHVIQCSNFNVTKPLRDIVKEHPFDKTKEYSYKEATDKRDMPVQTFKYTVEKNGAKYGCDPSIIQSIQGKSSSRAPIQNWAGQVASGFRPFDPSGAVGLTYYIQMINSTTYRIYNKSNGNTVLTGTFGDLWSPSTGDAGDPIVLYDKAADRWFMSQFDDGSGADANDIHIAISQTNDPTGSWYTYTFTSPDFPDYLKFSAWQDGYYMTANYAQKIFAFNRTKMLAGDGSAEAVYKTFSPPQSGFFVPLPADASDGTMPGAGTPCPIFSYSDNGWGGGNTDAVNIYNATVNWSGTPSMSVASAGSLATNAFDGSYDSGWDDISQPGTSQKLDGIGGAMMYRAQWKTWSGYNTVVLNWAVNISSTQRGIFWCELRQDQGTGSWSIYQQGIYAPGTDSYWMGSIAMNDAGDIGLSYAKGSSSTYMSLAYAGRYASDPLGTLPIAEVIVQAGTSAQTSSNRNGDYAQSCLDPDGVTFWHTGEYMSGGAKTRIYSYQFPVACTGPSTQASNFSATSIGDNQMTANWTRGNGDRVIILAKEGSAVSATPNSGTTYNASSVFASGDEIGTGNFVVYDGTASNVTVTGLTAGTQYHFAAFEYFSADHCYNTAGLTGNATTTGVAPCTPCASNGNTTYQTSTTLVNFNTINNSSAKPSGYSDYTNISTDVTIGSDYNLTVNVNTDGGFTVATKVWIDWNHNCDFTDAGEEYDLGTANDVTDGATSNSPLLITIPSGATLGNTTMRVSSKYSSASTPCQVDFDGEVEDYTINVQSATPPTPVATVSATPGCSNSGSVTVSSDLSGTQTFYLRDNAGSAISDWTGDATSHEFTGLTNGTYKGQVKKGTETSALSSAVTLTNLSDPVAPTSVTATNTTICSGNNSSLSYTGGSGDTFTWYESTCLGGTVGTGNNVSVSPTNTTTYYGSWENTCGTSSCESVTITVNPLTTITSQPSGATECEGANVTFTVSADNATGYQWKKGGTNISGATSASYTISGIAASDAGDYTCKVSGTCGNVTSDAATLTVNTLPEAPTSVYSDPEEGCAGEALSLFALGGSGDNLVWYSSSCGGTNIGNGTGLMIYGGSNTYYARWENSCGESTCIDITIVGASNDISSQPESATKCSGEDVTFSVEAFFPTTITNYQWKKNNIDITGANSSSYTIVGIATSDAGDYTCDVTAGTCGTETSYTATLTVNAATEISTQPQSVNATVGDDVSFSVVADNATAYQWSYNSSTISGADQATYSITNVQSADAGDYTVEVTGICGNVTSDVAVLTVSVSIEDLSNFGIKIYPNPSNGKFNIELNKDFDNVDVQIMDITGKSVFAKKLNSTINEVDLTNNANGVYFIQFNIDGETLVSKLILK